MLAHELGQPLGAALNYINTASRLSNNQEAARLAQIGEVTDLAATQVLRATRILDRLRDFITGGILDRQPECAANLVEDAISIALTDPAMREIELIRQVADNLPLVLVDKIQVQQVLVNIVCNAIEAMANSDRRVLRVTVVPSSDEAVRISVADSGPGVDGSMADRLFRPFASSKRNGMGLGLAISRSIVEAHGGLLWHEVQPGWGTVFCFTVPAAGGEARER